MSERNAGADKAGDTSWEDCPTMHIEELDWYIKTSYAEPYTSSSLVSRHLEACVRNNPYACDMKQGLAAESTLRHSKDFERAPVCYTEGIPSLFQHSSTQRISLLDLPTEILETIFLMCGPHAAAALASTCKAFHGLAWTGNGRLWKDYLRWHLYFAPEDRMARSAAKARIQYSNLVCGSKLDHFGEAVLGYRESGRKFCGPCRVRIDKAWMNDFNECTREVLLQRTLDYYRLPGIDREDEMVTSFIQLRPDKEGNLLALQDVVEHL